MQLTHTLQPVSEQDRLSNVDTLRGVALLGILLMNIPFFAMPQFFSEAWRADTGSVNFWYLAVITILFEGKMRALFSMLFGVGILLFIVNKQGGWKTTGLFYKRMAWLILFGLIDAHVLLWEGDILYLYGVCGLLAYLFHKLKPVYLALGVPLVAIIAFVSGTLFWQGIRIQLLANNEAKQAKENGQVLSPVQEKALIDWRDVEKSFFPNEKDVAEGTAKMKSGYTVVADYIRPRAWELEVEYLPYMIGDPIALMLLGMALYKWGFLSGRWSRRQYIKAMVVGYGLGLPLVIYSYWYKTVYSPNMAAALEHLAAHAINWVALIYDFQRILLVIGHASLMMIMLQSDVLSGLMIRLAAVGRMAFTNYVMQTLICTFVFFGYGLNYFAELEYYQLYFIVASIWVLQLWISPLWLRYFLFGPLEWAWRSLTYWKRQPMRRVEEVEVVTA